MWRRWISATHTGACALQASPALQAAPKAFPGQCPGQPWLLLRVTQPGRSGMVKTESRCRVPGGSPTGRAAHPFSCPWFPLAREGDVLSAHWWTLGCFQVNRPQAFLGTFAEHALTFYGRMWGGGLCVNVR